ncbi:unnamed protein product [Dracunculus medinensis]|uniref:Protein PTCD3 homolog, mitochondrial n=1 Tax=Dracunculus medinensis TaxID=318479 RepID=A0A3P7PDH2_DRAME|nr:unnamed protein product [Dracunculus medinensis]
MRHVTRREPTDLLKALAETIDVDTTAPHYSLIDDPALIPTSQPSKRNFYLAKEMGRKIARQLAEEWPTLFMYDLDEPRLPVFRPEKRADPVEIEPTIKNLQKFIEKKEVLSAIQLYERMRSVSIEVSKSIQMDLFRMLAYYNESDIPDAEIEEWHGARNFGNSEKESSVKWKGQIAELLFEELECSDETYSIMIAGLSKFPTSASISRAKLLFDEMKSKQMKPMVEAFCGLIRNADSLTEAESYLNSMVEMRVRPTIIIFNELMTLVNKVKYFYRNCFNASFYRFYRLFYYFLKLFI